MTAKSSNSDCGDTCSLDGASGPSCGCSAGKASRRAKRAKYGAGFIAFCAMCCAVPPVLIAFGLVGVTTGALLSAGIEAALIVAAILALGYLLIKYVKKNC
ncbi:hypothetical protein NBRC116596_18820 [Litorivita sp. NS0012-18]